MEQLPFYVKLVFILSAFFTLLLLYKSGKHAKAITIIISVWLGLQLIISLSGFYTVANTMPPRFALLLMPPLLAIAVLFLTKKGRRVIDGLDVKTLTLMHTVRVPVEITLYWLCLHRLVPGIMTFEGRNFDILCGITAPFVYYFGYVKQALGRKTLLAWNVICLLLLVNIVVTAVLSAPFTFQQLAFDRPNIALFYFPFVWLPCFIVPAALLAHLTAIRQLVRATSTIHKRHRQFCC